MKTWNRRKLVATIAALVVAFVSLGAIVSAQDNHDRDRNQREESRQQERTNRRNAKAEQERTRAEQQRQADWGRYNDRIRTDQQRQVTYNSRVTQGTSVILPPTTWDQNARYRVYRNGSFYNTDYRGAQLLQQAVSEGYRQGFQAGRADRNGSRRFGWTNSSVYRTGTYGYQSNVARNQYQYYFQQGFQRGYQDGSNSRFDNNYNGQYEYGYYENGSVNILGTILNTVLNIRSY